MILRIINYPLISKSPKESRNKMSQNDFLVNIENYDTMLGVIVVGTYFKDVILYGNF